MMALLLSSLLVLQVSSAPQLGGGGAGGAGGGVGGGGGAVAGAAAGAAGAAMMAAGTGMMVMNPTMALFPMMLAGASFVKVRGRIYLSNNPI